LETTIIAVRVPLYVKQFLRENGYNPRHILESFYAECKQNKLPKLREELQKARESVLQLEQNVIHLEHENDIKIEKNTQKALKEVLNSFNPEYYIGKTIDGVKITKKFFNENVKGGV